MSIEVHLVNGDKIKKFKTEVKQKRSKLLQLLRLWGSRRRVVLCCVVSGSSGLFLTALSSAMVLYFV